MLEILVFTIIIFAYCFTKAFNSALKKSKFKPSDNRPKVKGEENLSFITNSIFDPEEFLGSRESLNIEYYPYNDSQAFWYSHYDENTNEHVLISDVEEVRVINIKNIKRKYLNHLYRG